MFHAAHSYVYSFEPNPNWSKFYASAVEINGYLEGVAKKYSVHRHVKLNHEVRGLHWDTKKLKWKMEVKKVDTGETFLDEADVVIGARGGFTKYNWPEVEGLWDFGGKVVHSAAWDENYDYSHKKIGVIGVGSSAIQIIPNLQKMPGTQLSCFIRSQTWIATPFGESAAAKLKVKETTHTPEERRRFLENPEVYHAFRKTIESEGNAMYPATLEGSPMSIGARKHFTEIMQTRLAKKPGLAEFLIPSFPPGCRRLTPGPGFLESLTEDNVQVITTHISKVLPSGVELTDGKVVHLDVLVCATGYGFASAPEYPFIGSKGLDLKERYRGYPEAYFGLAIDGFPNYFTILGPNSAVGSGSATKILECQGDYIVKCIRKLQKEDIGSMEISSRAVRDWIRHVNGYSKRTVFMGDCKSWYKKNDRNIGIWPGSTCHAIETLRSPRWEDFIYTFADDSPSHNRLGWLGNGMTDIEQKGGDNSWYIEPENLDFPASPFPEDTEKWKKVPFTH
ncbi:FAD/NAD(P)-binding domain-containing protein [Plenodomus tracheiphilus IPT5]|uniref:L-ornithine N(5)-monooxygenase [NAD(P)H] n=1 Tax=Plenodomus tracheiphilus IPT5 TaxID=1408161 RepID=A0A6A7AMS4_9PLEO|nr:FAD/NAD(P)-binding domain-containing protein [Plenodomus tracheiphilus IPT5]